ncbi:hypothetical protein ACI784_11095 [Geodermatophilus sp. SYSU D01186]
MTVLMTPNQRYVLVGSRCRIEWQGLGPDDEVNARLLSEQAPAIVFPREPVTGLRPQPHAARGTWLLDLTAVGDEVSRLDLVVETRTSAGISLGLEVAGSVPGIAAQVLQHPGMTTVPGAPMLALRVVRQGAEWTAAAFDAAFVDGSGEESGSIPVHAPLQAPAVLARRENLVRRGETVTAVVDLSASMRPRLAAGTVAGVLTALQAVAGAADQRELQVVGVSDRAYGPRPLGVSDDAGAFLRAWVREIGLRTGVRGTTEQWVTTQAPSGLVVSISDQEPDEEPAPPTVRRHQVVLVAPGTGETPRAQRRGTVVLSEPALSTVAVVEALARSA